MCKYSPTSAQFFSVIHSQADPPACPLAPRAQAGERAGCYGCRKREAPDTRSHGHGPAKVCDSLPLRNRAEMRFECGQVSHGHHGGHPGHYPGPHHPAHYPQVKENSTDFALTVWTFTLHIDVPWLVEPPPPPNSWGQQGLVRRTSPPHPPPRMNSLNPNRKHHITSMKPDQSNPCCSGTERPRRGAAKLRPQYK